MGIDIMSAQVGLTVLPAETPMNEEPFLGTGRYDAFQHGIDPSRVAVDELILTRP
jgi:hypothetical protein